MDSVPLQSLGSCHEPLDLVSVGLDTGPPSGEILVVDRPSVWSVIGRLDLGLQLIQVRVSALELLFELIRPQVGSEAGACILQASGQISAGQRRRSVFEGGQCRGKSVDTREHRLPLEMQTAGLPLGDRNGVLKPLGSTDVAVERPRDRLGVVRSLEPEPTGEPTCLLVDRGDPLAGGAPGPGPLPTFAEQLLKPHKS